MDKLLESVNKIIDLLRKSSHAVVITGSGIIDSASSGTEYNSSADRLPTMVSPGDFTINRYKGGSGPFYEEGAPFFSLLYKAKPNYVHYKLAALEKRGLVKTIITYNIDGLHKMAGSKNVLELRGTIRTATCTQCEYHAATEELIESTGEEQLPLRCPDCGKPMKPDVALEGDPPPPDYHKAMQEAGKADLIIVLGLDMHIFTDKELIADQKELVVINDGPTHFDQAVKVALNEQPIKVMELIMEQLDSGS